MPTACSVRYCYRCRRHQGEPNILHLVSSGQLSKNTFFSSPVHSQFPSGSTCLALKATLFSRSPRDLLQQLSCVAPGSSFLPLCWLLSFAAQARPDLPLDAQFFCSYLSFPPHSQLSERLIYTHCLWYLGPIHSSSCINIDKSLHHDHQATLHGHF